jgi:uncharacterized protein (TIGR02117 family)
VAAPALHTLARLARAVFGWLALALGAYFLAGWIGSSIPRNGNWREAEDGVEIMLETNGVHTAIVVPLVTPEKDWRQDFPASDIAAPDRPYTHLSISWGDRQFYLETPTWADVSPVTVLRIVSVGGRGLLHVAHYVRPTPDETIRPLLISRADYAGLVKQIEGRMPNRTVRTRHRGYDDYDVFYDAPGAYTAINTCNQWTSDVLAGAGVRTGWWTPFAGGVMKWVPELRSRRAGPD